MDPVRRQRCETCAFHIEGPTSSTGRCSNPIWQPTGGAPLFVRDREMACYCGWGTGHWKQGNKPSPLPAMPPSGAGGASGNGSGGKSSGSSVMSRYGTAAGGRIVQLRLIDPQAPTDRLINEMTSDDTKPDENDHLLGIDHTN